MPVSFQKFAVIGDGSWGTTLAIVLARQGHTGFLWGPFPEAVERMAVERENKAFLPGFSFPSRLSVTADLHRCFADDVTLIILAVPSQYLISVLKKFPRDKLKGHAYLSVIKGIDPQSLKRMSEIIEDHCGRIPLAVLSGPTIAAELAAGLPTSAVVASRSKKLAAACQSWLHSSTFRIYTHTDIVGLELGGSLKNVIALACGVCDGLGLGTNTKAALITRGLSEIARLGHALGARKETFAGLAGLGDLVTTCFSPVSRNRTVGERLGRGETLACILDSMTMVAEGVPTARAAVKLGKRAGVDMPICQEVERILFRGKRPQVALQSLMRRRQRSE